MFNETVNCVGDIFLHKYALLHVSYHSHNRKQSDKVKVKVTKSKKRLLLDYLKSFGLFPLGTSEIIGLYHPQRENENDLRNRIVALCDAICNTPDIFERVCQSLTRRLVSWQGHF